MGLTLRRLKEIIAEEMTSEAKKGRKKALVKPGPGGFRIEKPESVRGYRKADGHYVKPHESESDTLAMEYTPESQDEAAASSDIDEKKRAKSRKKKKGKPKTYHASAGSVAALRDSGGSCEQAIKDGKFDWAGKGKWAACQSAHIVSTGKPTVPRGSKFVGGEGPHGGGEGSHMVKPRKRRKSKRSKK